MNMKPALLCVHIYYADMWEELGRCIANVTIPFRLYVTMVAENPDLVRKIRGTYPDANIEVVENRGYDVGPFVHIIKNVNLNDYSFVIKLHTKRDMAVGTIYQNQDFSGDRWRRALLDFISSKEKFSRVIDGFCRDAKLGMVANHRVHHNGFAFKTRELYANVVRVMADMGLALKHCKHIAGTMFIARAELFIPIQKLGIDLDDFEVPDKVHSQKMAHLFEVIFGYIVYAQGYEIRDCYTPLVWLYVVAPLQKVWVALRHFVYHKKVTTSNKVIVKILKIPVYNKQIRK